MAAPVVNSITFDPNTNKISVVASGGNQTTSPLWYKLAVNRGTVARVATGIVSSFGGVGPGPGPYPQWTWTDNWPGQGEGPPLYIACIARDQDGRCGFAYTKNTIAATPLTIQPANAGTIDFTGTNDSSAALQSDIAACPPHRRYQFPAGGLVRTDSRILLNASTDILIDPNGGGLKRTICYPQLSTTSIVEFATGSSAMQWVGGTITGHYVNGVCGSSINDISHGVKIAGASHSHVSGVTFSNITGENVSQQTPASEFLTVHDCVNNDRTDRQGFAVVTNTLNTTSGAWFVKNNTAATRDNTYDLEPDDDTEHIRAVRIIECTGGAVDAGAFAAIQGLQTTDTIVANCTGLGGLVPSYGGRECYLINYTSSQFFNGPNGAVWVKNARGLFMQSLNFTNMGNAHPGMRFDNSGDQIRLYDSQFKGANGIYYVSSGTQKDFVQAGNSN